jgi:hypothetical protein
MVNYFTENGEIRSALNQNVAERTDKLILLIGKKKAQINMSFNKQS